MSAYDESFAHQAASCSECGAPYINCPSGHVCSDGCGRIRPGKLTRHTAQYNAARLLGVPQVKNCRDHFSLPDGTEVKRLKSYQKTLCGTMPRLPDGQMLCIDVDGKLGIYEGAK